MVKDWVLTITLGEQSGQGLSGGEKGEKKYEKRSKEKSHFASSICCCDRYLYWHVNRGLVYLLTSSNSFR